jgi:hypothetical protein
VNALETSQIDSPGRDIGFFITAGSANDSNIIVSPWWYTTSPGGPAGWGNPRGNTGVGYVEVWDDNYETVDSLQGGFNNFDGTHYDQFTLRMEGSDATQAGHDARLTHSPWKSNDSDHGTYVEYELALTAYGLEGVDQQPGTNPEVSIVADNQPTGVGGYFRGIFENTGSHGAYNDFYAFDFDLNTVNWAFENKDNLTLYQFFDSYFEGEFNPNLVSEPKTIIPEPSTYATFAGGLAIILVFWLRRRRQG